MLQQTIKFNFNAGMHEFSKENIGEFMIPVFARTIVVNHVRRLKNFLISNGYQFGSAIIAVRTGSNKLLVVDGNHRITAFRELIEENPETKIYSVLIEYPSLSMKEMKELMKVHGVLVRKQNTESLLEIYQKDIDIFKYQETYPVKISIRNKKGSLKLSTLVAFLEVKDVTKMHLVQQSLERFIKRATESNKEDVVFIKNFLNFFEDIFGRINSENRYAVSSFMIPLASVFGYNYETIQKESSAQRFQKLLQDPEILDLIAVGGRSRQILTAMRKRQVRILNKGLLKNQSFFE